MPLSGCLRQVKPLSGCLRQVKPLIYCTIFYLKIVSFLWRCNFPFIYFFCGQIINFNYSKPHGLLQVHKLMFCFFVGWNEYNVMTLWQNADGFNPSWSLLGKSAASKGWIFTPCAGIASLVLRSKEVKYTSKSVKKEQSGQKWKSINM